MGVSEKERWLLRGEDGLAPVEERSSSMHQTCDLILNTRLPSSRSTFDYDNNNNTGIIKSATT